MLYVDLSIGQKFFVCGLLLLYFWFASNVKNIFNINRALRIFNARVKMYFFSADSIVKSLLCVSLCLSIFDDVKQLFASLNEIELLFSELLKV